MKKSRSQSARHSTARLQRGARKRADDEARRIPWQRLYDARNEYIDWQEFYLRVRSILEVADGIPDWPAEILNSRCPGFLETEKALAPKAVKTRPLRREVLPHAKEAWYVPDSVKTGYEISFIHCCFYKPQPLRTLQEIRSDIVALEKETEGLLEESIGSGK